MSELWALITSHMKEISGIIALAGIAGFLVGRGAMALKSGVRIYNLEKLASKLELDAQENARSAQDLYDRAERAEQTVNQLQRSLVQLPELAQRLSSVRELQNIPPRALDLVQEIFGASYSAFFKTRRGSLVVQAVKGHSPFTVGEKVKPGEGVAGITAMKQVPITAGDLKYETAQVRHTLVAGNGGDPEFSICLPVLAEHLTIGVILIGPTEREIPNARELGRTIALLTSVSMTSAVVLIKQKLVAKIDGLTTL
ncbi:MAG: hypothetical protein ACE5FC_08225, partial [Myxococcota bacterium]